MAYDKNLDVQIFLEEHNFEGTRVSVGVFQYNNGEKKLQISRQNANAEGELTFAKLGRLRKAEAEGILPSIQKALQQM